jgi:hypothetical protein
MIDRTAMSGPHARARHLVPLVLFAAVLGACADRQPTALEGMNAPDLPARVLQAFDCTANVRSATLRCEPARTGTGLASGVLIGGQNTYVRLASTNLSYDDQAEVFQFDATVQNLMNEAIGTPDGVVADPDGIQVFFVSEPATSGGTGEVTILNATATGFFTAADQPYFAYPEILDKDETSSALTWQFGVPTTVTSFSFTVLLEADVQYLLVINEVLANPNGAVTSEQPLEWVELYNAGTRPVDLQNLVIADSAASGRRPYHLINTSVVVPSGGYVVLGGSTNTTLNGGAPVDYSYGTALNQLANSLDAVKIARVYGNDTLTVDRTQYAQASTSAKEGISRELKNPALDNSNMDGSNWDDAAVTAVYGSGGRGTPKAQNSTYTP